MIYSKLTEITPRALPRLRNNLIQRLTSGRQRITSLFASPRLVNRHWRVRARTTCRDGAHGHAVDRHAGRADAGG